jgi:hypothetical protein
VREKRERGEREEREGGGEREERERERERETSASRLCFLDWNGLASRESKLASPAPAASLYY